jgi:hypothetical protein
VLKILLNAGKSSNIGFAYVLYMDILPIIHVKIAKTRRQSAGVRSILQKPFRDYTQEI